MQNQSDQTPSAPGLFNLLYVKLARFIKKIRLSYDRDFDFFFEIACNDFGILQKTSEIKALCDFVAESKPELICEIGSYRGGTSFLLVSSQVTAKKFIFIDREIYNEQLLRYFSTNDKQFVFVEGDSCSKVVLNKFSAATNEEPLDFLFIDGDHSFDGVKNDLVSYYSRVKDGGLIAFHDIVPDYRTLYNRQGGSWSGEVYKLWGAIKGHFESYEFIDEVGQDGFGIGIIRKNEFITAERLNDILESH